MEAKEYTGWRHGTSKQHAPQDRNPKKKSQNAEKKTKIILHPLIDVISVFSPPPKSPFSVFIWFLACAPANAPLYILPFKKPTHTYTSCQNTLEISWDQPVANLKEIFIRFWTSLT